jgi:hypothetical protein
LEHPQPTTVKELQGLLGIINFYRRFVPAVACILKPLTDQLKGNPKPAATVCWTAVMQAAFEAAKAALAGSVRVFGGRLAGRQARIPFTVHGPAHSLRSPGDSAEIRFCCHHGTSEDVPRHAAGQ